MEGDWFVLYTSIVPVYFYPRPHMEGDAMRQKKS